MCELIRRRSKRSPGNSYCAKDTQVCETLIPAVASHHALELFNGGLATGLGLDRIAKTFIGLEGDAYFGESMLRISSKSGKSFRRRMKLIGFTNMAINGTTIPIGYVKTQWTTDRRRCVGGVSLYHREGRRPETSPRNRRVH